MSLRAGVFSGAHQAPLHVIPTCCAGAAEAGLRRHACVNRGGGAAAEVNHGGRGRGRCGGRRGLLCLVALGCVGGDAVLRQELLQVHVLQLKVVPIVGQGLVPEGRAKEGRLWVVGCAALIVQLLLFLLLFPKSCKCLHTVISLSYSRGGSRVIARV